MTQWQVFLQAMKECSIAIIVGLLLVCILGLINELTSGWHGKGD